MTAELFAYPDVLNGIVLAPSTRETVFTDYMIYRATSRARGVMTRLRSLIAVKVNRRPP